MIRVINNEIVDITNVLQSDHQSYFKMPVWGASLLNVFIVTTMQAYFFVTEC